MEMRFPSQQGNFISFDQLYKENYTGELNASIIIWLIGNFQSPTITNQYFLISGNFNSNEL